MYCSTLYFRVKLSLLLWIKLAQILPDVSLYQLRNSGTCFPHICSCSFDLLYAMVPNLDVYVTFQEAQTNSLILSEYEAMSMRSAWSLH